MDLFDIYEKKEDVKFMQPLVLAMIGDSVQTLFVRSFIAKEFGVKVNKMNKLVSSVVSAGAQFLTFKKIEESLKTTIEVSARINNADSEDAIQKLFEVKKKKKKKS